ncbi:MAG: M20/M25/M40 family metallo-hydrolase [Candidatus Dormibacteraceae bacterium]
MRSALEHYRYLKPRLPSMVEELKAYVAVESCSRDKEGVDRVGVLAADAWRSEGFEIEVLRNETSGNHVVARRRGQGRGRLLCHMHLDTTQPRGTIQEEPVEETGDRLYGPGILDMKGGWIVLLSAFRALAAGGWDGLESATVFMCGDEELGSPTGRPHIEELCRSSDWQVIMEPSRSWALTLSRGLVGAIYLTVHGSGGDAPGGDDGVSAIVEAARKVLALEALSDRERGSRIRVGIVEAGASRQTLPLRAWLSVDLRARSQREGEDLVAGVRRIAERAELPGSRTEMEGGITRPLFSRNEGSAEMLRSAASAGSELGLAISEAPMSQGGSDGNFGAAMGLPSLDGLGALGGTESNRQFIYSEALPQKGAVLAAVIQGLPDSRSRR